MARKRVVQLYRDGKRNYEVCLILHQKLSEEDLSKKMTSLKSIIEGLGDSEDKPEVVEVSTTKVKTFSYPIENNSNLKGYYACIYTKTDPKFVKEIRTKLALEVDVLRVVVILANPKKQSYGIFSSQYETDSYKSRNKFFSFDDPNALSKFLGERARIADQRSTLGKKKSKKDSKIQRAVSKVIKTARALSLLPYQED